MPHSCEYCDPYYGVYQCWSCDQMYFASEQERMVHFLAAHCTLLSFRETHEAMYFKYQENSTDEIMTLVRYFHEPLPFDWPAAEDSGEDEVD